MVTADEGKKLKVKVSYTDDGGTAEEVVSAETEAVGVGANTVPEGADRTVTTDEDTAHTFCGGGLWVHGRRRGRAGERDGGDGACGGEPDARRYGGDGGRGGNEDAVGRWRAGVHASGGRERGGVREFHVQGERRDGGERGNVHDDG